MSHHHLSGIIVVFVKNKDYICVNWAPLFLYLYDIRKNLEEHGASVVNSSYALYEEGRMPVPPPPHKMIKIWDSCTPQIFIILRGYSFPQITVVKSTCFFLRVSRVFVFDRFLVESECFAMTIVPN